MSVRNPSGTSSGSGQSKSGNDVDISKPLCGWLHKWTNYIKGYRQRWFVLAEKTGTLTYYRNQAEVGHTCRGSINLQEARIHTENSCNFIVSGSVQTFHLKASNEVERQKWVTGLELARHKAIKATESDEDEELKIEAEEINQDDSQLPATTKADLQNTFRTLEAKMEDLKTCQELISKHGSRLLRTLSEYESLPNLSDETTRSKILNERATLFRITTSAMINACSEFVALGQMHAKKWNRLLSHATSQRIQLQEQLEQLARQHSSLERAAWKERKADVTRSPAISGGAQSDEELFHDAIEEVEVIEEMHDYRDEREMVKRRSRQGSQASFDNTEERNRDYFNADIVTCEGPQTDETLEPSTPEKSHRSMSIRQRRTRIPDRPQVGLNLWSIMRNCIGKELSKIPMPVNFNEPLSVLQRLTEDLEYASILHRAASKEDSTEQMCYIAAYSISSYSTTGNRATKPFNPLLGETYECDRMEDLGWRSFTEQVCHHPPVAAHHAEGKEWKMYQDFTMTSKFRGKYLSVIPVGFSHVEFKDSGNHYVWRKATTTVHNIIVGKLWIDNHGEIMIENHKTGDKCRLKLIPYSYFSRDVPRKVTGVVQDKAGIVRWVLQGTWDSHMDALKVIKGSQSSDKINKSVFETLPARRIWSVNSTNPESASFYHFTKLAVELNEPEEGVAPTDSRLRPDQRLMEMGKWDEANKVKLRLEEKQRTVRRQREAQAEQALNDGCPLKEYESLWFHKIKDEFTGGVIHEFLDEYWKCKDHQQWDRCPKLYE